MSPSGGFAESSGGSFGQERTFGKLGSSLGAKSISKWISNGRGAPAA
ncbi:MAG: hypothetical protein WCB18_01810 [Thermoplasmata archaeon]